MPSFASGLAAGLSPGIKFYGDSLAQDRAEKLFDARLADQRKYNVMQSLISEATRAGIPANEIAEMQRYGDTDAFASVLEERKRDFDAGSSPAPTAPTKQQSESSSFLYGQRLRNQEQAVKDFNAGTALDVAINAEKRTAESLREQTESVRNYQVRQALTIRANQAGMDPTAVSDMEGIGDLDFYSARVGEAERDYSAGLSFVNANPTPEQLRSPSFLKGRRERDDIDEIAKRNAAKLLAVKTDEEARSVIERADSAKNVREHAELVDLRERGVKAGMPQGVLNDLESFGDLKAFSVLVRRAEEEYRKGSSFSPTVPTEAEGSSESFSLARELRDELLSKQNKADELKRNELIIQDELLQRSRHISALRGQVGSIEGLPQYWISRLFSKDGVVSGEAFDHISQNLVQRTLNKEGIPTTVWTYKNIPKPKPTETPSVNSAADKRTEPPPVNSAAGKSLPPSSAKPVVDEVAELNFWRKLPVYGYSKENDTLLKSDDPNVWRPALRHIKSNTTLRPGTYVGAKPTYHWTPGKSSFQSVSTNSLPMMPASIDSYDSDPR